MDQRGHFIADSYVDTGCLIDCHHRNAQLNNSTAKVLSQQPGCVT